MTNHIQSLGSCKLPDYSGIRIMMMPFYTHDVFGSLPPFLQHWTTTIEKMTAPAPAGTGYLTIDEALVKTGDTHRRPGLHVDGIGPDGELGGWGGGGGWGSNGMTMVSSHAGCQAWNQDLRGRPGPNGDCAHLASELNDECLVVLRPDQIYACSPMLVHEAIPMTSDTHRQFCRVSFPSNAPWYDGYTKNPLGIMPAGPIRPARTEYMGFRP